MSEEQKNEQGDADGSASQDSGSQDSGSESSSGSDDPTTITDDQLPEDLRPTDDNPLAKPEGEDDDSGGGLNLQEQAGDAGAPPG
jgi:hypothetical protein